MFCQSSRHRDQTAREPVYGARVGQRANRREVPTARCRRYKKAGVMLLDLVKADTGSAMSALGQTRRFRDVRGMSGLPQTADISGPCRHFAFGPKAVWSL